MQQHGVNKMLKLTAIAAGSLVDLEYNDVPTVIKIGDVVEYLSHVPGGNVKIRMPDGKERISHPGCFKELR
jgi:hypothetical protein